MTDGHTYQHYQEQQRRLTISIISRLPAAWREVVDAHLHSVPSSLRMRRSTEKDDHGACRRRRFREAEVRRARLFSPAVVCARQSMLCACGLGTTCGARHTLFRPSIVCECDVLIYFRGGPYILVCAVTTTSTAEAVRSTTARYPAVRSSFSAAVRTLTRLFKLEAKPV